MNIIVKFEDLAELISRIRSDFNNMLNRVSSLSNDIENIKNGTSDTDYTEITIPESSWSSMSDAQKNQFISSYTNVYIYKDQSS